MTKLLEKDWGKVLFAVAVFTLIITSVIFLS